MLYLKADLNISYFTSRIDNVTNVGWKLGLLTGHPLLEEAAGVIHSA